MLSTNVKQLLPVVLRAHLQSPAIYPVMGYMARDYTRRFSTAMSHKAVGTHNANAASGTIADATVPVAASPIQSFFHNIDDFFPKPFFTDTSLLKQMSWIDDIKKNNSFPNHSFKTDEDKHTLSVDLPGVSCDEVKAEIKDDNILHIFGGRKTEGEDGSLTEMKFDKKFSFGDAVDTKNIIANMKDGVLRLTLPKVPKADPPTENIYQIKINQGTTGKGSD
mmetsp:Transcript_14134/g.21202  ORF Transcript_14134/g.21202 Transcript_14134/m.21202 type:complete len:221 (-) Transcript_14134:168-830(-)